MIKDTLCYWMARWMPRRIAYFCFCRIVSFRLKNRTLGDLPAQRVYGEAFGIVHPWMRKFMPIKLDMDDLNFNE